MARKPSTRMHEVADISGRFTLIVHCGSQTSCYAFVESQPARRFVHQKFFDDPRRMTDARRLDDDACGPRVGGDELQQITAKVLFADAADRKSTRLNSSH